MILKLHTEVVIDIAHHLKGYDGNCSRVHGHTGKIEIWIKGESKDLNKKYNGGDTYNKSIGILFDFGALKDIKNELDHKDLNELHYFKNRGINPTAENIVIMIYDDLKLNYCDLLFKVRYYETVVGKETWVEYGDFE